MPKPKFQTQTDVHWLVVRPAAECSETLRAKSASILRQGERNTWLVIALDEGKNRHIRRMLDQMGIEVLRLVRVAIGPLLLGELAKDAYRALAVEEKRMLDRAMDSARRHRR